MSKYRRVVYFILPYTFFRKRWPEYINGQYNWCWRFKYSAAVFRPFISIIRQKHRQSRKLWWWWVGKRWWYCANDDHVYLKRNIFSIYENAIFMKVAHRRVLFNEEKLHRLKQTYLFTKMTMKKIQIWIILITTLTKRTMIFTNLTLINLNWESILY